MGFLFDSSATVNDMWLNFLSVVNYGIVSFVPKTKIIKSKKKYYPRFKKHMLIKKNLWHNRFNLNGFAKYKAWAIKCKKCIKRYHAHKESELCDFKNNKAFYMYLNNKMHSRPIIPDLFDRDDNVCSADLDKANALNFHFGQKFIDDNGLFPPFANRAGKNFIYVVSFTVSKVEKALSKINFNCATGPDHIPDMFYR